MRINLRFFENDVIQPSPIPVTVTIVRDGDGEAVLVNGYKFSLGAVLTSLGWLDSHPILSERGNFRLVLSEKRGAVYPCSLTITDLNTGRALIEGYFSRNNQREVLAYLRRAS